MNLERDTRRVFDSIHRAQMTRPASKERLRSLITTDYLGVPADYFNGKACADIGCGSAVHGTINLLRLGARHVSACDLDESIIEPATEEIEPDYAGRYSLHTGSVHDLPFDDEQFDFFICDGVLHHLHDQKRAIEELSSRIHRNIKGRWWSRLFYHSPRRPGRLWCPPPSGREVWSVPNAAFRP